MEKKRFSRRDFLRLSALTAAGAALAGCAQPTEAPPAEEPAVEEVAPTEVPTEAPVEAPAEAEQVVMEIGASNPEYENAERQVWDIYEAENPNVKIELFSVNEDTQAAFQAKLAGGWTPAFGPQWIYISGHIGQDTYEQFLDLSTIDFPWWDRFTHDPLNKVPELYGYGPRCININAGFVFTWEYHKDLMEEAGLDPRSDVKTWDDLLAWMEAGTEWANSTDEVDFFWDQGWHAWAFGGNYMRCIPLACQSGERPFNGEDSPYRHTIEFYKLATDEGWIPENWWTREWETDMEASYIAKKSVMMLHGPWPWDKMLASDPTAVQEGIPATPPAEGQEVWVQFQSPPRYAAGQCAILDRVKDMPEWPEVEKAFAWYHSPPIIKARLEILGQPGLYELDEPLELTGPQWVGVVKEIATPGGFYEDVQYTSGVWGELVAEPKRIGGTPGAFDWESGALVEPFSAVMKGEMTVQEILDWFQANWEQSYDL